MSELLKDPVFFYAIAFVLFIAIAYAKGKKPILEWLDGEILKIRSELDQARSLRFQAEETLAEYKAKQAEALAHAAAIVQHAKQEASQMKAQAEIDLKAALVRHEKQALERIRMVETEALASVRNSLIDMAMTTARQVLASQLDSAVAERLIDQAISDISPSKADKAKAA